MCKLPYSGSDATFNAYYCTLTFTALSISSDPQVHLLILIQPFQLQAGPQLMVFLLLFTSAAIDLQVEETSIYVG